VNFVPEDLRSIYGSRRPLGAMVFLRLRPSFGTTTHATGMEGMHH
jgi:hypothetical protein